MSRPSRTARRERSSFLLWFLSVVKKLFRSRLVPGSHKLKREEYQEIFGENPKIKAMAERAEEKKRAREAAEGKKAVDAEVKDRRAPANQIYVPQFAHTVPALAPARSAIILDGRTFHAKGNSESGEQRWILNAYFCQP